MDIPQEGTVGAYLRGYGYVVHMDGSWENDAPHPELCLQVLGHERIEGHTCYTVRCALQTLGLKMRWDEPFRLVHLRKFLYEPVRSSLWTHYQKHFARAPFAFRGGIKGTTARLDAWCNSLANCINARRCTPGIVWLTLCFLQVPEVSNPSPLSLHLDTQKQTASNEVCGSMFHAKPVGQEDACCDSQKVAETQSMVATTNLEKRLNGRCRHVQDNQMSQHPMEGKLGSWSSLLSSVASVSPASLLERSKEQVSEKHEDDWPRLVLSKAQPSKCTSFEGEPVWLHIYDVCAGSVHLVNSIFRKAGTGAFHAGVEAFGCEWSYGFTTRGTGVYSCPPRSNTRHQYRESVLMGSTTLSEKELQELLQQLRRSWDGPSYDLCKRNCCHFSNVLLDGLGVGAVPKWAMNLADAGAVVMGGVQAVADFAAVVKGSTGQHVLKRQLTAL